MKPLNPPTPGAELRNRRGHFLHYVGLMVVWLSTGALQLRAQVNPRDFQTLHHGSEADVWTLLSGKKSDSTMNPALWGQIAERAAGMGWTNVLKQLLAERTGLPEDLQGHHLVAAVNAALGNAQPMALTLLLEIGAPLTRHPRYGSLASPLPALFMPTGANRFRSSVRPFPASQPPLEKKLACLEILLRSGTPLFPVGEPTQNIGPQWSQIARAGDPAVVDYLLTNAPPKSLQNGAGLGVLHLAVLANRPHLIPILAARGMSPLATNGNGLTPLHLLAERGGRDPILKPPPPILPPPGGFPPGFPGFPTMEDPVAVRSNRLATAATLVAFGARHDVFTAAGLDDTDVLAQLLSQDSNLARQRDSRQRTPLHWAVANAAPGTVSMLLKAGADPAAGDLSGETPIHNSLSWSPNSILPLLLKSQPSLERTNHAGLTPLASCHIAALSEILIAAGAKVEPPPPAVRPLIAALAWGGDPDVVEALLNAGARLDLPGEEGLPLAFSLVKNSGRLESLALLVAHGLDLNLRDASGNTLLHAAAQRLGDTEMIQIKPSTFHRLAAKTGASRRAWQWLETKGWVNPYVPFTNMPVLQYLIRLGADPRGTNRWGESLAHKVLARAPGYEGEIEGERRESGSSENLETLKQLQASGVPLDSPDREGLTPFLTAVRAGRYGSALGLLGMGVNAGATTRNGDNAYHLIVSSIPQYEPGILTAEFRSLLDQLRIRKVPFRHRNIAGFTATEILERRLEPRPYEGPESFAPFKPAALLKWLQATEKGQR